MASKKSSKSSRRSKSSKWKKSANRRNAEHSTGPRSPEGKEKSKMNATTHGIFCHALVLTGEDAALFEHLREESPRAHKPQNLIELQLVDRIVIASWKLRRVQEAEAALHASKSDQLQEFAQRDYEQLLEEMGIGEGKAPSEKQ